MKKIQDLGKKLSKDDQKVIIGGIGEGGGCLPPLASCGLGTTPCCPGYICSGFEFNDEVCQVFNP